MFWLHEALRWIVVALRDRRGRCRDPLYPSKLGSIVAAVGFCFGGLLLLRRRLPLRACARRRRRCAAHRPGGEGRQGRTRRTPRGRGARRAAVDAAAADQQKVQDYAKVWTIAVLLPLICAACSKSETTSSRRILPSPPPPVRGAGAAARSDRRGRGAKASLAAYRAALANNRRLVNDRAFWNDFKEGFSNEQDQPTCRA